VVEVGLSVRLAQALLLALASAASASTIADAPALDVTNIVTKIRLTADRIEYSGLITHEANAGVLELYQSADPKPQALLIESQGGSADAGMELGAWLFENGLQVQIDTYCFSSCANYVFPAGRTKLLAPHASLMWHGGVTQPITPEELAAALDETLAGFPEEERRQLLEAHSRDELMQQLQQSLTAIVARETHFFRKLGVDQRITTLGHLYERELLKGGGYYMGWDFSLDDMARLGVHDISIEGGAAWEPVFPVRGQRIYRIRLDELPDFRPQLAPTHWRRT
jgi:ATP-dependent protease ClpP protease subunit